LLSLHIHSKRSMQEYKKIKSALISVFYKDGLDELVSELVTNGVTLYSTGGTRTYLESLGHQVEAVEDLTSYPSILGGRVKTLHPKVFGGILGRREEASDLSQLEEFDIPLIDLVIVDLYPFTETISKGASEQEIIEKIDIGGVSLIRAAAKNFNDVVIISSKSQYAAFLYLLRKNNTSTSLKQRKTFAGQAFSTSAAYDAAIANWFNPPAEIKSLRYGENPHQKALFSGDLQNVFTQLHGKEISYNNLLDIDAALSLIEEFPSGGCAVIKHNNACGAALSDSTMKAWEMALAGDPVSAFGGIIVFNTPIDLETATALDALFFEILLAPDFSDEALEKLKSKKNRIILKTMEFERPAQKIRTVLNGVLVQDRDNKVELREDFNWVSNTKPDTSREGDFIFANLLVKHTKSNAIVLVKNNQLIASGTGQTSRVDALNQAIDKAKRMGFEAKGSVMASDAFFPFADCIEIAANAGITTIIQPGGSIRDKEVIDAANNHQIAMAITGTRHFNH
jgi:phosphoribosylaminoimidazolecarboxamide formyltransferase / IMP cyclohydrolase